MNNLYFSDVRLNCPIQVLSPQCKNFSVSILPKKVKNITLNNEEEK